MGADLHAAENPCIISSQGPVSMVPFVSLAHLYPQIQTTQRSLTKNSFNTKKCIQKEPNELQ